MYFKSVFIYQCCHHSQKKIIFIIIIQIVFKKTHKKKHKKNSELGPDSVRLQEQVLQNLSPELFFSDIFV